MQTTAKIFALALLPVAIFSMTIAPVDYQNESFAEEVAVNATAVELDTGDFSEVTEDYSENADDNPHLEEKGKYFEGDMILTRGQLGRSGILGNAYRWPNRIVYYRFEGIFATDVGRRNVVIQAMNIIQQRTCIRFAPVPAGQNAFVFITNRNAGCYSYVGRIGRAQELNLQVPGCDHVGTAMHELIHAIGFYHEQSRPDRDNYVNIHWQNIDPNYSYAFNTVSDSLTFNVPYDYSSVMHYSAYAFSKNGQPTISAKGYSVTLGGNDLTSRDAAKINAMYSC